MTPKQAIDDQPQPQSWVTVAHLLRPQGRRGELLAELLTDFPHRFTEHPRVFLRGSPAVEPRAARVESHWLPVGRNAGRIVLKLEGIDSIEAAEALAGSDVLIPATERIPLEEGAIYISDLIGCTVTSAGQTIGIIEGVNLPITSDGPAHSEDAAPLLTLRSPEGREVLIPFIRAWLQKIDLPAKSIAMDLPPGLLDLN